jgi:O-antigen ligase
VAVSPYLFGSADPWAYLLVCIAAGLATATWLVSVATAPLPALRAPGLTLALLCLLLLLSVQMLPLSPSLAGRLSPIAARARTCQIEEFERAGAGDFLPPELQGRREPVTVSAAPAATARSLWLLAAYAGVFLVLANCLTERRQLRAAAAVLAASGFVMAVFGILQKLSGTHSIYWFHIPRFGGNIFGPFTNRNHYAVQMNMLLGVTLGLLLGRPGAGDGEGSGHGRALSWRERTASHLSAAGGRTALLGFAAALMAASVCVSLSRGGIGSLVVAVGLIGTVVAVRSGPGVRGKAFWAVGLLLVGLVVWLGWRPVVERLGSLAAIARDPLADGRAIAKRDTLRLFASAPILGSGFGCFQYVFPLFQSPAIQQGRWLHAHDDYAQLLAEGGVVGACMFGVAAVTFMVHAGKRLRRVSRQERLMACGLAIGIVAVALHSFVDYGLHKPANAFLFSALCGMMVACVHVGEDGREIRRTADGLPLRLATLVALAGVAALILAAFGAWRGDLAFRRFLSLRQLTRKTDDPVALEASVRSGRAEGDLVIELSRGDPDALWTVSATFLNWSLQPELDPFLQLSLADRSVRAGALAVRAGPSDYNNWLQLARAFYAVGLGQQAQDCLQRAREFAPPGLDVSL